LRLQVDDPTLREVMSSTGKLPVRAHTWSRLNALLENEKMSLECGRPRARAMMHPSTSRVVAPSTGALCNTHSALESPPQTARNAAQTMAEKTLHLRPFDAVWAHHTPPTKGRRDLAAVAEPTAGRAFKTGRRAPGTSPNQAARSATIPFGSS
jgi:hypothetical protein